MQSPRTQTQTQTCYFTKQRCMRESAAGSPRPRDSEAASVLPKGWVLTGSRYSCDPNLQDSYGLEMRLDASK